MLRYWREILLFGCILAALVVCCAPSITWINTDCDGHHYMWAARDLRLAHATGAPLFLLIGHLFIKGFDFLGGTDFWRMGLISVLSCWATCVLLYLIARRSTHHVVLWFLCPLLYVSCPLVFGQSTIVETYAITTFCMVLSYYMYVRGWMYGCAIACGLGLAIHHLFLFASIPILVAMVKRKQFKWRYLFVCASFLVFYIYVPLVAGKAPYLWGNSHWWNYLMVGNQGGLFGGLAIWLMPERIGRAVGVLGILMVGLPLIMTWIKKDWLLWVLTFSPIIYYTTDLAPQTVVYVIPGVAFGSILLVKVLDEWERWRQWITVPMVVSSCVMLVVCTCMMDIGRTLDKDMGEKIYEQGLSTIPDGSILLLSDRGWEYATAVIYFSDNNKDVAVWMPSDYIALPEMRKDDLASKGYKTPTLTKENETHWDVMTWEFLELNPQIEDYYTSEVMDPRSYESRIIRRTRRQAYATEVVTL